MLEWIDVHCHLDRLEGGSEHALQLALAAGVKRLITIGTEPADLPTVIALSEKYSPHVFCTIGVHPHDGVKYNSEVGDFLRKNAAHPRVVAIGEIGLDYHYDFSPRELQREVFTEQLKLARELSLPIIIHTREAWDDTIAVLTGNPLNAGGIMHCFSGDTAQAEQALSLGFHLSFGGVITFKNAGAMREAARITPDNRLLIETDAPYLAPIPHRGKRNEPAFMTETARKLAEVRGTTPERIAELTAANFDRLCLQARNAKGYTEVSHGN